MTTPDLQHEQFLMAQARASGRDWRPGEGYVRAALGFAADVALEDPPGARRIAQGLLRLAPFAWARGDDGAGPTLSILLHAPEGEAAPEEREAVRAASRAAGRATGYAVEGFAVDDTGTCRAL